MGVVVDYFEFVDYCFCVGFFFDLFFDELLEELVGSVVFFFLGKFDEFEY